jgi:hypothetical protein
LVPNSIQKLWCSSSFCSFVLAFVASFICVVLFGNFCYGLKSFCWFIRCLCALQFMNLVIILFLYLVMLTFASCFFNLFFGCFVVLELHRHIFCEWIYMMTFLCLQSPLCLPWISCQIL